MVMGASAPIAYFGEELMTKVYKYVDPNGEEGTALRFFYDTVKNEFQSAQQSRPIFDKVLRVEVICAGSKESIPVFEITRWITTGEADEEGTVPIKERKNEQLHDRYKKQLDAFLTDSDDPDMVGTPIEAWTAIDVTLAASCKEAKIYTVEALANLPDGRLNALGMGARGLRERARAFLDASKGNAGNEALAGRVAALEAENERLQQIIGDAGKAPAKGLAAVDAALAAAPEKSKVSV